MHRLKPSLERVHVDTLSRNRLAHTVPVLSPMPVGVVDWVQAPTRLYGIDSIGQVFVFRTPVPTPRHLSPRHAGHLRRVLRWFRA